MGKLPLPNNVVEDLLFLRDHKFTGPTQMNIPGTVDLRFMVDFFTNDPKAFWYVNESVEYSTAFDFSNVSLAKEDIQANFDFAIRLLKDGLFTLPFNECLFVLSNSEAVLLMQDRHQKGFDGLIITPCVYCPVVKQLSNRVLFPLGSFTNISALWQYIEERRMPTETERIDVKLVQFLTQNGVNLVFEGDHELYALITMELVKTALACNQLLMSPHVKTEHSPAPTKLNKARALKGKPFIGDRYKITLRDFDIKRDPATRMVGGSHASPRPHWRRGHLRHLEGGRIVPVIPTVVGAQGTQSDIGKKMYEYARRKE